MQMFSSVSRTHCEKIYTPSQLLLLHLQRSFCAGLSSINKHTTPSGESLKSKFHRDRVFNPWKSRIPHDSIKEQTDHLRNALDEIEHLDIRSNTVTPNLSKISQFDGNGLLASWIGHSTALIQSDGLNFLTDPIWSQICSPISFLGPKRSAKPAIQIHELPKIDFIVISHNHYDHLDYKTVQKFGDSVTWFIPLGLADWFKDCNINNIVEMDWWEEASFKNFKIVCTPAKHWSCRTIFDRNKSLWCSWTILGPNHRFFFTGDTGYCPVFKDIGNMYGPFDLAAIPIGAYAPRNILRGIHINPVEAVQVNQ